MDPKLLFHDKVDERKWHEKQNFLRFWWKTLENLSKTIKSEVIMPPTTQLLMVTVTS